MIFIYRNCIPSNIYPLWLTLDIECENEEKPWCRREKKNWTPEIKHQENKHTYFSGQNIIVSIFINISKKCIDFDINRIFFFHEFWVIIQIDHHHHKKNKQKKFGQNHKNEAWENNNINNSMYNTNTHTNTNCGSSKKNFFFYYLLFFSLPLNFDLDHTYTQTHTHS